MEKLNGFGAKYDFGSPFSRDTRATSERRSTHAIEWAPGEFAEKSPRIAVCIMT